MCGNVASECGGRGLVGFFAMAALMFLDKSENWLTQTASSECKLFFLTHQHIEQTLGYSLMDFQNFTDTLCVFLTISTVITFLH